MRREDLCLTIGESGIFGHEQHFERVSVGKRVLKLLVVSIVDTVELFGDIAVTPFVTCQFSHITAVCVTPFGRSPAAALYLEFHRRDIFGCSVGIEYDIKQVGFRQGLCERDGIKFFR